MVTTKTFRTTLVNRAKSYANESHIHGLRYITATGNIYEKIFWSVLFLACTVMAALMIKSMADRFYESPTITTIENPNYPIGGVEFPAITICTKIQVSGDSAEKLYQKFVSYGLNESLVKRFFYELPSNAFRSYWPESKQEKFKNVTAAMDKLGYDLEALLLELSFPCKIFMICRWLGELRDCSDLFQKLKTPFGFCCSFNWQGEPSAVYSKLNERFEAKKDVNESSQPLAIRKIYVNEAGKPSSGMSVTIIKHDYSEFFAEYTESRNPKVSVKILLHGSTEYPDSSLRQEDILENHEARIIVRPSVIESSPNVRSLSVQQRQCFFPEENPLNMKGNYSYEACMLEFKLDRYNKSCGCIPFYYPSRKGMKSCGLSELSCLSNHKELGTIRAQLEDLNWTVGSSTHCLESCNTVRYKWSLQASPFKDCCAPKHGFPIFDAPHEYISVFFEDNVCMKYRTESLVTWESLIASFGGIFGLFLGGSVFSLIEIIYHFTYGFVKENRKQEAEKRREEKQENTIAFIENASDINSGTETKMQKIGSNNERGKADYPSTFINGLESNS